MLIITMTGPANSGKTWARKIIEKHKSKIEQKTGHQIAIHEVLEDLPKFDALVEQLPTFRVMRFKASGKWIDTFYVTLPFARDMSEVPQMLKTVKEMPKGGSMVVVTAMTPAAEKFFYPIEVKDESTSN